ncbi:unnamed protein product [Rotaria sp. Silwood1]|nr:unnamed protein product [Rotaria sp. Silwood1]
MLALESNQWNSVRTTVVNFSNLLYRSIEGNTNTVDQIIIDSMLLAAEFHSHGVSWSSMQQKFKEYVNTKDSNVLTSFINMMDTTDTNNSIKSVIKHINQICSAQPNEELFENTFQLCQMMINENEQIQLKQKMSNY